MLIEEASEFEQEKANEKWLAQRMRAKELNFPDYKDPNVEF